MFTVIFQADEHGVFRKQGPNGVSLSTLLLPLKDRGSLQAKESNSSHNRFRSGEYLPFRKII